MYIHVANHNTDFCKILLLFETSGDLSGCLFLFLWDCSLKQQIDIEYIWPSQELSIQKNILGKLCYIQFELKAHQRKTGKKQKSPTGILQQPVYVRS